MFTRMPQEGKTDDDNTCIKPETEALWRMKLDAMDFGKGCLQRRFTHIRNSKLGTACPPFPNSVLSVAKKHTQYETADNNRVFNKSYQSQERSGNTIPGATIFNGIHCDSFRYKVEHFNGIALNKSCYFWLSEPLLLHIVYIFLPLRKAGQFESAENKSARALDAPVTAESSLHNHIRKLELENKTLRYDVQQAKKRASDAESQIVEIKLYAQELVTNYTKDVRALVQRDTALVQETIELQGKCRRAQKESESYAKITDGMKIAMDETIRKSKDAESERDKVRRDADTKAESESVALAKAEDHKNEMQRQTVLCDEAITKLRESQVRTEQLGYHCEQLGQQKMRLNAILREKQSRTDLAEAELLLAKERIAFCEKTMQHFKNDLKVQASVHEEERAKLQQQIETWKSALEETREQTRDISLKLLTTEECVASQREQVVLALKLSRGYKTEVTNLLGVLDQIDEQFVKQTAEFDRLCKITILSHKDIQDAIGYNEKIHHIMSAIPEQFQILEGIEKDIADRKVARARRLADYYQREKEMKTVHQPTELDSREVARAEAEKSIQHKDNFESARKLFDEAAVRSNSSNHMILLNPLHEMAQLANGLIDGQTGGTICRKLGLAPSQKEISTLIANHPDGLGFHELMDFMTLVAHCDDSEETLVKFFEDVDPLRTGTVTKNQFRNILMSMGEPMTEDEINMTLKDLVGDNDTIDYRIFCKRLMQEGAAEVI